MMTEAIHIQELKDFEDGTYVSASLNTTWADYADYKEKYADNAYESLPNASVFGVVFNFNRQNSTTLSMLMIWN